MAEKSMKMVNLKNTLLTDILNTPCTIYVIDQEYDLEGGIWEISENCILKFNGGSLKNGKIVLNDTFIEGSVGIFDKDLILTGTLKNDYVHFDWFTNEKVSPLEYATFINGNNPDFGVKPIITDTNRIILSNLLASKYIVKFGSSIYGFDDEVIINTTFYLKGNGQDKTLLFCPHSGFLHMTSGGGIYPYIKDISIEAWGNILNIQSWTVNAIHGFEGRNSTFISYKDHAFKRDISNAGGTGAPMYGSLFSRCLASGGAGMSAFYEITSNSNVYDNVVDAYIYFSQNGITNKGIQKALFWNSNMLSYCNANIVYGGMDYLYYTDKLALFYFVAQNNTFEGNNYSFKNLVYCEDGNVNITMQNNRYITPHFENNYAIYSTAPNTYIWEMDPNILIYGILIRNFSDKVLTNITPKIDSQQTKYRIKIHSPYSSSSGAGSNSLLTPNPELAASLGISDLYTGNESDISYFEVSIPNIERTTAYLTLPKQTNNAGINNLISKTQNAANGLSFGYNDRYYVLHALPYETVRSINNKSEYDALWSSGFKNGTILVTDDIDLEGLNINLRSNITILCLGGSINNGTITLNENNDFVNFKGNATILGENKKFGTPSVRPTINLHTGYMFFDTSLNKPIWYNGNSWVDALGNEV